jgi:hypothetical protein
LSFEEQKFFFEMSLVSTTGKASFTQLLYLNMVGGIENQTGEEARLLTGKNCHKPNWHECSNEWKFRTICQESL